VEVAALCHFLDKSLKLIRRRETSHIQSPIENIQSFLIGLAMGNETPHNIKIPDKLYFKIGEVSRIAGLPSHVLRFWEGEFKKINPRRTAAGQRAYTRKDIETILEIKHLLYDRKFTIDGARRHIGGRAEPSVSQRLLAELKSELINIRDLLDDK
jgi:DNA-binding transcriptional MerR regulator